jgi:hypothetical protein
VTRPSAAERLEARKARRRRPEDEVTADVVDDDLDGTEVYRDEV